MMTAVFLMLLDLSAALDTLEHMIILSQLEHWFVRNGFAVDGRIPTKMVCCHGRCYIQYPKPWVRIAPGLGTRPVLFTIYIFPLERLHFASVEI